MTGTVSIIIPVKQPDDSFWRCLQRIAACSPQPHEVIVVIDGLPEEPLPEKKLKNIQVEQLEFSSGPAAARNRGARIASGEILLFTDSDVLLPTDIVTRLGAAFARDPRPVAVFGSYDEQPEAENTVSQYKNLFHYYTHQSASSDAFTFWTGCGAILRDCFFAMGGFEEGYKCPSIEDIELGYRVKASGHAIFLDKSIQVTHLKHWTLSSLVRTDFFCRAIPWSRLIIRHRQMNNDMNIDLKNRISVALSWLVLFLLIVSLFSPKGLPAAFFAFCGLLYVNRDLFRFFYRKKGMLFLVQSIALQYVYYIISGAAFIIVLVESVFHKKAGADDRTINTPET